VSGLAWNDGTLRPAAGRAVGFLASFGHRAAWPSSRVQAGGVRIIAAAACLESRCDPEIRGCFLPSHWPQRDDCGKRHGKQGKRPETDSPSPTITCQAPQSDLAKRSSANTLTHMARSGHARHGRPGHGQVRPGRKGGSAPPAPDIRQLLEQGGLHQANGNLEQAAVCYREVLEKHPNQPDALHLLGTVALGIGDPDVAIGLFNRALHQRSKDLGLRLNLANAFLRKDEPANAEIHLRKALKISPDNPSALSFLANCTAQKGDAETARQMYEDLLRRDPDFQQATFGYAHLCLTLGDLDTAAALYGKALTWGEPSRTLALIGLASCKKIAPDSPEAAEIEQLVQRPGLSATEALGLRYAAGRLAEAAGRYDDAFKYFADAKALLDYHFDIAAHRRVHATLKSLFTREFLESRKQTHGDSSTRPVFIVGMPRSGTTLTEQILSSHPSVASVSESAEIRTIAYDLGFRDETAEAFAKRVSKLSPAESKALARRYLAAIDHVPASALRVVDKMPHNFTYLGLISLLFPNAKIIHARRDPLDTCVSCFTAQMQEGMHPYMRDLETLGAFYREYEDLMAHWRKNLLQPICESQYEELIASPEEQSRRLIDFIGLPWDPACLEFHKTQQAVRTNPMEVRQPIYTSAMGRWRRYEKHLGPLKAALGVD
jgi:tetratricopeptide (TPR) repeat protein